MCRVGIFMLCYVCLCYVMFVILYCYSAVLTVVFNCGLLQSGFDTLNQLIPGLSQNSTAKISKATTLHKGSLQSLCSCLTQLMGRSVGQCSMALWRHSRVVRTLVSAGELSPSCARLLARRVTTLWLSRLL